jgi:hypothetical protein
MGTELRIRRVSLEHAEPEHSWRFPDGVTVIVGASGGGKSSLLHLIHYGLGMNQDLVDEITRASSGVILDIHAGGLWYPTDGVSFVHSCPHLSSRRRSRISSNGAKNGSSSRFSSPSERALTRAVLWPSELRRRDAFASYSGRAA